ncbi:MAG: AAA family ATPase [Methanosarcinales archaeon]|nr:AAA family ATPase [Methanosarcinales archaeon]
MKILQLNLLAFGHFTDTQIDLSKGEEGFHIIYGSNEAGKSSALRALQQMLYGIDTRSSDNFLHHHSKMRIGGVLRHSNGSELDFIRRKGRVNTILAGDTEEVLEESLLETFLGGVDADTFTTMFGIDHSKLVKGGEKILEGGGNIGQALFAAGSGITDLRKVQNDLRDEAEELFTPTSRKKIIDESLSDFKQKKKEIREAQLPAQEWQRHEQELRNAEKRIGEVTVEFEENWAEKNYLGRIGEALPLIGKRKELLEEYISYADVVLLPEDFGERRGDFVTKLRIAENERDQATKAIEEIETSIESIDISEAVLKNAKLIDELYKELGSHQKAARDLIKLQTERSIIRSEAKEIISGLRDDLTLDEAEKLRLKKIKIVEIRELSTRYDYLLTKLENSQERVPKLSSQIVTIEAELESLGAPLAVDNLRDVVERAKKYEPQEDYYHSESEEIRNVQNSLKNTIKKQILWQGTLEELEKIYLPSIETIDTFETRFEEHQRKESEFQLKIQELEDALLENEGQFTELQLEQDIPTEEDLEKARQHRQDEWGLIRCALDGCKETDETVETFVRSFQPEDTLTGAYELSVKRADELADRLRREADSVARKAKLIADSETKKNKLAYWKNLFGEAKKEVADIRDVWNGLWKETGMSPGSPKEMRAWTHDQRVIVDKFLELRGRIAKADKLNKSIQMHRGKLNQCLNSISEPPAEDGETLTDLIRRSQKIIEGQDELKYKRKLAIRDKSRLEEELNDFKSQVEQIEEDLSQWQKQWEDAIQPLGLEGDSRPSQADAVMDDLQKLFEKLKEAKGLHERIKGIESDAEGFTTRVFNLAENVAQDLKELHFEQVVTELNARLASSKTAKSELKTLKKQQNQELKKYTDAESSISKIKLDLDVMCKEAGCSRYEELPEVEKRSSKRRQIEEKLEYLDEKLLMLSAGATVEDLRLFNLFWINGSWQKRLTAEYAEDRRGLLFFCRVEPIAHLLLG